MAKAIILRLPRAGVWGGLFTVVFIGGGSLFLLGVALFIIFGTEMDPALGLFALAVTGFAWWLLIYVLRDTRYKMRWQITLTKDEVHLDLPRWRSSHRVPAVNTRISYAHIEAVETRFEAYRAFGMTSICRLYALKLKSGDVIILGQDGGLATSLATAFMGEAIDEMIQYGNLAVRDLGMAIRQRGILNTGVPRWDAPSLSPESQVKQWRRVEYTSLLVWIAPLLIFVINILQSFFS